MKFIKHILVWLLWLGIIFSLNFSFAKALWTGNMNIVNPEPHDDTPSVGSGELSGENLISDGWESFMGKLKWIIHVPSPSDYETKLWYTVKLIQIAINRLLGILSFIALIYLLYCGFLIFSSWSDDKNVQKGKKWISIAAIALAWIWLSWLVSAMLRFIKLVSNSQ